MVCLTGIVILVAFLQDIIIKAGMMIVLQKSIVSGTLCALVAVWNVQSDDAFARDGCL